jgi:hypothetical protein
VRGIEISWLTWPRPLIYNEIFLATVIAREEASENPRGGMAAGG